MSNKFAFLRMSATLFVRVKFAKFYSFPAFLCGLDIWRKFVLLLEVHLFFINDSCLSVRLILCFLLSFCVETGASRKRGKEVTRRDLTQEVHRLHRDQGGAGQQD